MLLRRGLLLLVILGTAPLCFAQSLQQPDVPTGLLGRKGAKIVDAPPEDFATAKTYHSFPDKGRVVDGQRITILTARQGYKIGEPVRVIHVYETVRPGIPLYMMGPQPVSGEWVDGRMASGPARTLMECGLTVDRPIASFNYDITTYTFTPYDPMEMPWEIAGRHA